MKSEPEAYSIADLTFNSRKRLSGTVFAIIKLATFCALWMKET
jgi:hypothetical protein